MTTQSQLPKKKENDIDIELEDRISYESTEYKREKHRTYTALNGE